MDTEVRFESISGSTSEFTSKLSSNLTSDPTSTPTRCRAHSRRRRRRNSCTASDQANVNGLITNLKDDVILAVTDEVAKVAAEVVQVPEFIQVSKLIQVTLRQDLHHYRHFEHLVSIHLQRPLVRDLERHRFHDIADLGRHVPLPAIVSIISRHHDVHGDKERHVNLHRHSQRTFVNEVSNLRRPIFIRNSLISHNFTIGTGPKDGRTGQDMIAIVHRRPTLFTVHIRRIRFKLVNHALRVLQHILLRRRTVIISVDRKTVFLRRQQQDTMFSIMVHQSNVIT